MHTGILARQHHLQRALPVPEQPALFRFSTHAVEQSRQLEYWIEGKAPVAIVSSSRDVEDFHCDLTATPLAELNLTCDAGGLRDSRRTKECVAPDREHSFHLMADFGSAWTLQWRGTEVALRPGDLVFTGSRYFHSARFLEGCAVTNIKMPSEWVSTWLQNPERLVGKLIARDVGWGRALSTFASQISPGLVTSARLPPKMIAQNLGSLLSLVEAEMLGRSSIEQSPSNRSADRVAEIIRQRACEPGLSAQQVAFDLGQSERALHRNLSSAGLTFTAVLTRHRMDLAKRMLEARNFDRLTTGEIGIRAGFADPSYFVRTASRYLGETPARYRAAARR